MLRKGKLKAGCRRAWARFLVRFARDMSSEGLPLWGMSVQNEPAASTSWENCLYNAQEERDFVRDHLGPALEASSADLRLLVWDHNRDQMVSRARTIYSDPEAAKYVWGMAFHWYGDSRYESWAKTGQVCFENVARVHEMRPDKHLIMTEACQEGGPHIGEFNVGERYAESIIKDLNNWTEAWIDWNLVLDREGGPNHVSNFCSAPIIVDVERDLVFVQPAWYCIAHFSRFIRPGAQRILCASSRDALETTAFINTDGSIAAVVLNQTGTPIPFWLVNGASGKAAQTTAPPHSITTFVLRGDEKP